MKIALLVLGVVVVSIGAVALIGVCLPRAHVATRAATYRKPPAELYALVRAFDQGATWRSGVKAVELLPPDAGRVMFREQGAHRAITYRVLEDRPGEKLVTEIADENLPFGGKWTYEFAPAPTGGTVRITEHGDVKNVIFRFVSRFVIGHAATIETYLGDLGRKLGDPVTPVP